MAQTIAISNQKGGVAKTTTCFSLGACFAEAGHPTLIVDLDPQANLSLAAGIQPDAQDGRNLADLLIEVQAGKPDTEASGSIFRTSMECLDILPTDPSLSILERDLYRQPGYETYLTKILEPWQSKYEYILIDCLPSLGSLTIMALTAAQKVLVPVQCDYLAAWGVMNLIETIDAVREHTNPSLEYILLVTQFDSRNNITKEVFARLQEKFQERLLKNVIGVDTRLRESVVNGEPVIRYAPRSRASTQYRALAKEWMARFPTGGMA